MHKILFFSAFLLFSFTTSHNKIGVDFGAKCTGSSNCRACKNCSACGHCNSGGSCAVCVRMKSNSRGKNLKGSNSDKEITAGNNKIQKIYQRKSATSHSKKIYTGPRGGRYYINSNGNKTYVK